ncbi:B3 domain-containing protein LFL1-like [Phragmites australis]|uniref:B3 domain-containing protein LFL1-like n=1 Tax=Phragmites australis TaxID=29695 RepID=UPI002D766110|nr:B3 domain-containing protein LFL1-like [Phragmites australis]
MTGISKGRPSPTSTSSSSGDSRPRRITRKRRSARRGTRGAARRPPAPRSVNELDLNTAALDPDHYATGLRVILQKELRNSDVSQLGRIVLPKKEAEAYLPILISKDGKSLCMQDLLNAQLWTFKYRYWPNNKSRMYVLENTGDYVRAHDLQQGDFIVIYRDDENNRFVIGAKKAGDERTATVPQLHEHISATLPASQVIHDYAAPVAPEADILAMVPQANENYEIFDGILNSLPEIPVANVRYSDFFDPFGDCMDMTNPLNASHSVHLAAHFHDDKTGNSSLPYPNTGPQM